MESAAHPIALKADADSLLIEWSDGAAHRMTWRMLRDRCPCATCRETHEQPKPMLPVLGLEETRPIRATSVRPVGNYAYAIHFSDGHGSGIYTLESLRQLGEGAGK